MKIEILSLLKIIFFKISCLEHFKVIVFFLIQSMAVPFSHGYLLKLNAMFNQDYILINFIYHVFNPNLFGSFSIQNSELSFKKTIEA